MKTDRVNLKTLSETAEKIARITKEISEWDKLENKLTQRKDILNIRATIIFEGASSEDIFVAPTDVDMNFELLRHCCIQLTKLKQARLINKLKKLKETYASLQI